MLQRSLNLKKDLVVNVCEPYIKTVEVKCHNNKFKLCRFGRLEVDDTEYVFGTEENQYNSAFSDSTQKVFPVVIAKKRFSDYELVPFDNFRECEQDMIRDAINYTLESQQTMTHYMLSRC